MRQKRAAACEPEAGCPVAVSPSLDFRAATVRSGQRSVDRFTTPPRSTPARSGVCDGITATGCEIPRSQSPDYPNRSVAEFRCLYPLFQRTHFYHGLLNGGSTVGPDTENQKSATAASRPRGLFAPRLRESRARILVMNRRSFLKAGAGSALMTSQAMRAWGASDMAAEMLEYKKPVFDLHRFFNAPVKIASIELLRAHGEFFLRTRSADGAEGIIQTKDIADYIQILAHRVVPHFLGKDARDLEQLIDEVYAANSNYKLAGQEFWCPVAYIEQSLFDLMGKAVHKPAGELMGGVLRKEIPVYLSGSGRETTAEEEVDIYVRGVESTGAKAVKFKIGGRMSDNRDASPGRTDKLLELGKQIP